MEDAGDAGNPAPPSSPPPPTDVEAVRLRLEGRYDTGTGKLLRDIGKWGGYSPRGAEQIWLRLVEPKLETFLEWVRFGEIHGKPAAKGMIHNYDHPADVPEEPTKAERESKLEKESIKRALKQMSEAEKQRRTHVD